MAKEQNKAADQTAQEGKKSKKKLLMLVGVSVLILAGGAGFAWKMGYASKFLGGDPQGEQAKAENAKETNNNMGPTYALGTFIVNLNDPVRRSYLKVKAELELTSDEIATQVEQHLPKLRDGIILLLSSKTFEEIASLEGKVQLRQELMRELQRHLGKESLKAIYFTEFVVQ